MQHLFQKKKLQERDRRILYTQPPQPRLHRPPQSPSCKAQWTRSDKPSSGAECPTWLHSPEGIGTREPRPLSHTAASSAHRWSPTQTGTSDHTLSTPQPDGSRRSPPQTVQGSSRAWEPAPGSGSRSPRLRGIDTRGRRALAAVCSRCRSWGPDRPPATPCRWGSRSRLRTGRWRQRPPCWRESRILSVRR